MRIEELKNLKLPDSPGVYFFIGQDKEVLYIGRATSLRDRVKSYFVDDVIHTRGARIVDMVTSATTVEYIQTDSVLEAIILEAKLIKKYQPKANVDEKDDKSFNYVVFTDEAFPRVMLVRGKELEFPSPVFRRGAGGEGYKYIFGPYPNSYVLKEGLKIIRKIFAYRDEKCKLLKPCFNYHIGLCPGPCAGVITKQEYGRTIQHLKLFFEGKKSRLLKKLEQEMKAYAKKREFEKATEIKRKMFALTHIQDVQLVTPPDSDSPFEGSSPSILGSRDVETSFFRIEGYDVAHMSGQHTGGVMVVLENYHVKKSDYRLFKIKRKKGVDDIANLKEVLDRRLNHAEWPYPNLIVVDGNNVQKTAAEKLLTERGFDIAVVAVTKNDRHKPETILGEADLIEKYKKEILLINSEAHRFAIKYHRKMRKIQL